MTWEIILDQIQLRTGLEPPTPAHRDHLSAAQQRAEADQAQAKERFKGWAQKYVEGARHMNVCSSTQVRQLFFAGIPNSKDASVSLEDTRVFKVLSPCFTAPGC